MVNSKFYDSADAVRNSPVQQDVSSDLNNTPVGDTNAPSLKSRQLLARLGVIRELYRSETTPAGKKRYRKEAQRIKLAIGEHSRKMFFSTGSLVMAIALMILLLQKIGLIL